LRVTASGSGVSRTAIGSAEGGHRLVVDPTSGNEAAFRDSNLGLPNQDLDLAADSNPGLPHQASGAVPNNPVAVSALDPSRRVQLACERPSDARTQGDRNSSAIRSTEDEAARSVGCREMRAAARGEGAPFPPSTTPSGRSLLSSYKPAGRSADRALPESANHETFSGSRAAVNPLTSFGVAFAPYRVTAPRIERSCVSTKTSTSTAMTTTNSDRLLGFEGRGGRPLEGPVPGSKSNSSKAGGLCPSRW
jgi:hypothetical protein